MEHDTVATFTDVHKTFGATTALAGVDLAVRRGETLGLLGPNGAGKTTLISLLTGLRRPDRGAVRLFEQDPTRPAARLRLGVTPQATAVPATLRVREMLGLVSAHFAAPRDLDVVMAEFGLAGLADKQAGGLSGGQQRRLLVALAMVGNPELVVLDEPTTGLDVEAREVLWAALRRYRDGGGTLVLTSHYLAEVEALCSRVVVVDHGRVVADGTVDDIRQRVGLRRVVLDGPVDRAALADLPGAVAVTREGTRWTVATRTADDAVRALVRRGVAFTDLEVHGASLEEAFVAMTSGAAPDAPPSASTPSTVHDTAA